VTKKLAPRFENRAGLLIAGLGVRYREQNAEAFGKQWQRFAPFIGRVQGQVGPFTYGVVLGSFGGEEGFEYVTGVAVSSFAGVPPDFRRLTIPAQRYAVFIHTGDVSGIRDTVYSIKKEWLPKWMIPGQVSAWLEGTEQPDFFERYGKDFDPKAGTGKIEIWVPVKR
jgi:AraC family transcriptional regulator